MSDFNAVQHYQQEFHRLQSSLPGGDLAWMNTLREQALAQLVREGFPQKTNEEWKYSSTLSFSSKAFRHELAGISQLAALPPKLLEHSYRCVFIDGHYQESLSDCPTSITILPLHEALRTANPLLESTLKHTVSKHGFQLLNLALMQDGLFIHIPRDQQLDQPIEIFHWQLTPELASQYRHAVIAETGSQATIIEVFKGMNDQSTFTNAMTDIAVGANAHVLHCKIIEESLGAHHIGQVNVMQREDSVSTSFLLTLSGGFVRSDTSVDLEGLGATTNLNGLYLGTGKSHIDHHTDVHHIYPQGTSRELYKGILNDQSHAVFNGKVIVYKDAQKTDATQTNKNLLISKNAEVDTKPQLEIFADDVKCTHGATVGQMDAESLFYLQSRGLTLENAQELLMHAFISDVIDTLPQELRACTIHKIQTQFMPLGALA